MSEIFQSIEAKPGTDRFKLGTEVASDQTKASDLGVTEDINKVREIGQGCVLGLSGPDMTVNYTSQQSLRSGSTDKVAARLAPGRKLSRSAGAHIYLDDDASEGKYQITNSLDNSVNSATSRREKLYYGTDRFSSSVEEITAKMSDERKALAEFILNGVKLPADINRPSALRVLGLLAGRDELKQPEVAERFNQINQLAREVRTSRVEYNNAEVLDQQKTNTRSFILGLAGLHSGKLSQGECVGSDPNGFFPGKGESSDPAKKICASCCVRVECLEQALVNDEKYGVWGGKNERERRKMRTARRDSGASSQVV
jgi:WhiB family redox-sensing transcriptional regulator